MIVEFVGDVFLALLEPPTRWIERTWLWFKRRGWPWMILGGLVVLLEILLTIAVYFGVVMAVLVGAYYVFRAVT